MRDNKISVERKKYLKKVTRNKIIIFITQILLLVTFIAAWEICANANIIDSFITSKPSRILDTFMNLSQNGLLEHIGVTCFETIIFIWYLVYICFFFNCLMKSCIKNNYHFFIW